MFLYLDISILYLVVFFPLCVHVTNYEKITDGNLCKLCCHMP